MEDRISFFSHFSKMADERHSFFALLLMGLAVLASAQEELDEALYLFLSSQVSPPPSCPENELYLTCSGNCSDCARRGACPLDCSVQGCVCLPHFARLEPGGPCQPVHLCPLPECGENEVFRECGAACERCGGLRCRMLQCEHRCYCAQGHLRDDGGRCVPEEHCPRVRCFRDEEPGSSGREDEFCLRDEGTSNATVTRDRCYCRPGHSRDALGRCVRDELCERVRCPGVEVYQSCPRKCRVSCGGDSEGDCREDGQCFPGCFCPDGFLADHFRRCVPENQCPPTTDSSPFSTLSTEPTESPTPLTSPSEVQVSCSSPATAEEGDESQLPGDATPASTNTTESDGTTPNSEPTHETTQTPAATAKPSTPTADTSATAQETTTADDEATTSEEEDEVATTGTTSPPEEEENDF